MSPHTPKPALAFLAALLLAPLAALHAAEPTVFDITAFGAKGDGTTLNTQAIQQAVDACHGAGGGVVRVPEGVFLTGSLRLKSGIGPHTTCLKRSTCNTVRR